LEAGPHPKLAGRVAKATGCSGKNGGYGELYTEERNKTMWRGRLESGSSDVDLRYCCSELTETASSPQQGKATGGVILLLVSGFCGERVKWLASEGSNPASELLYRGGELGVW
jgi:hypothetical protein